MESLANKYRPQTFEEALGQQSIINNLRRQLEMDVLSNCYLFCGPSGCGKTTIARIFAKDINKGLGEPIEIDGASNNGVDNIRQIIEDASRRSVDSKYKIYIIDECHQITNAGWNAFLKCIEEPPMFTIFMFCTTDPQKVPATIINRVMRFNLSKVSTVDICNRLKDICIKEQFKNYDDACDYIAKISDGGVRDAIALLDKCSKYSDDLNIDNVLESLGNLSYTNLFKLVDSIVDGNEGEVITLIDSIYDSGIDMKLFIEQFLEFSLDLNKYCLFKTMSVTKIPLNLEQKIKYSTGIENNSQYYGKFVSKVLTIKNSIKNDTHCKNTILVLLLEMCRGI